MSTRNVHKKLVAMVLAMSLVLFLSGCNKAQTSQSGEATTAPATATGSNESTPTPGLKPVTLKILGPHLGVPLNGVPNDPVAQEIAKQTGITMDITSQNGVGDINAKIAALLATNDLPDIVFFPTTDLMQKAISAKALLPMDDYLQQYGQDLVKNVPTMIDYSKKFLSKDSAGNSDGKLYFLTTAVGTFGYSALKATVAPYLRWDLYKKLGYPKIDSLDDYIPILQQMMKLEPTNANGKKNYGVGAWFGDGAWKGDWNIWGAAYIYGGNIMTYSQYNSVDNPAFQKFATDPNSTFFKLVSWWNKANRAGVLDPDSFTMKNDNFTDKMKAGREFMTFANWQADAANSAFEQSGHKDVGLAQMLPPKDSKSYWVSLKQDAGTTSTGWAISKNTKHPEQAMKLLNYLASYEGSELVLDGVKGQTWDEIGGKAVLKKETIDQNKSDPDFGKKTGMGVYSNALIQAASNVDPKYNSPISFFNQKEVAQLQLRPFEKDETDYYKVTTPLELVTNNIKDYIAYAPESTLMNVLPPDLQDKANKIDTYVFNNYIKMILAKTDEEYKAEQDKFIKGVQSLGYDEVVDWYNTERTKALNLLK